MNVTIFGGASPRPGEPAYEEARRLGELLARAGHCVLTGGYVGTMEAVSRGAAEAGGHVIGVTCDEIEAWRPVRPNAWVHEERRFTTLRQRLFALMEGGDAAVALPGGIGTLTEVAETWSHAQIGARYQRPLVLVGSGWQRTLETFITAFDDYIRPEYRGLLRYAADVDCVLPLLD